MTHPLVKVCSEGRSLIFCIATALSTADRLSRLLVNAGVNNKLIQDKDSKYFSSEIAHFNTAARPVAMLIKTPGLAAGWKCHADRVIWIGDTPLINTPNFALYSQAMARADRAWRQAEKFTFTEQQLIDG